MLTMNNIAFKVSCDADVMIFIKGTHVGKAVPLENAGWKRVSIEFEGVAIDRTLYMPDRETSKKALAEIINFELQYQAPFRRLKELKRITRKDINACLTHIVENEYRMSKDDIIKHLQEIVSV